MKTHKLTLIELLISMAIFTVMISLLIKAFQVTSDLSSQQESRTQKIEQSQLALGLMASELKAAMVRRGTSWVRTGENVYTKVDKSMHFYIDTTDGSEEIRFYYPNEDYSQRWQTYISLIQYKMVNGSLMRYEKSDLVAYEDPQWVNHNQGTLKLNVMQGTNHVLGYSGVDTNDQPKELLDLSASQTGETILEALDGQEGLSDFSISYHISSVKNSTTDPTLMTNPSLDSDGAWQSLSSGKAILNEGQKPDFITINFTLGTGNTAKQYSRMISLNGR